MVISFVNSLYLSFVRNETSNYNVFFHGKYPFYEIVSKNMLQLKSEPANLSI